MPVPHCRQLKLPSAREIWYCVTGAHFTTVQGKANQLEVVLRREVLACRTWVPGCTLGATTLQARELEEGE